MKLALVIERYDPQGGGAERSTAQIARELANAGHEVTILTGAAMNVEADTHHGITVESLGLTRRFGVLALRRFGKWARQQLAQGGYDASLSVTTTVPASVVQPRSGTLHETFARNVALRSSLPAKLLKKLTLALSPKHRMLLSLERRTLRDPMVKRFAAVSQYVKDQLTGHYAIAPGRVVIIPNAAAMPQVTPEQRQAWRDEVRQGFNIPADAVVYLFAALNPRLKGAGTLIDAAALLKQRGVKGLVILMAGQMGYAQQHQAAQRDVREQLRFVGATRHMERLYSAADVTVLPSYYDPASKVVIESLMLGVPAISTRYNGASDMILPGEGITRGRVINDPGNAHELADAMEQLADPAARAHCAAAAAGLGDALSMKQHVRQLIALFEQARQD